MSYDPGTVGQAPEQLGRPATIHDVAKRAGVSSQTVTRFLSGFSGIRPQTRQRVQEAIDDLGWRPNPVARALRLGKPTRILLFVHEIEEAGPSSIIVAATRAAADMGSCWRSYRSTSTTSR